MNDKLAAIVDEAIDYSDGSFHIQWPEGYEKLTPEEQREVQDAVYSEISDCEGCGWHFHIESMETHADGQSYCWRCYEDVIKTESEEGEEDAD